MKILNICQSDQNTGKIKISIRDGLRDKSRGELKGMINKITNDRIHTIRDKSKCFDVFQKIKLYDQQMYADRPTHQFVSYKAIRSKKNTQYQKIRLIKNLKSFSAFGCLTYCELIMKCNQLMKDIFVLDVEQGDE